MTDPQHMAPLAAYHGHKPPAPPWFDAVMAHEPERTFVEIEGAKVEVLAWGERGKSGLMFLHGGAAHADWWSFIAPFFAAGRRVVASTFTGMGRSDWRERYVFEQFVREARAAGEAAGAFEAGKPVVIGHSFGGRVAMGLARDFGDDIAGAVMVDPPFFAPQNFRPPAPPQPSKLARPKPSLAAVVARFRLMPPQPVREPVHPRLRSPGAQCARRSTRTARPVFRSASIRTSGRSSAASTRPRSSPPRAAPMALVRGANSKLFKADDADYLMSYLRVGVAACRDPRSRAPRDDRPAAGVRVSAEGALGSVAGGSVRRRDVKKLSAGASEQTRVRICAAHAFDSGADACRRCPALPF